MKRKVVLALLAGLTLTVGSMGTAFAMNSNPVIELQDNEIFSQPEDPEEHVHAWGDPTYVIDQEAVYDKVEVIDQEEKWDWVTNIITPAWDEDITEVKTVCYLCQDQGINTYFANGKVEGTDISIIQHCKDNHGGASHYGQEEVVVDTIHHEAVTERVWTKVQDKISHFEDKLVTPEKGHWEHTCADCGEIQNVETGEVIKPGTLPDEPENPNPDDPTTEEPENPNPDDPTTEEPENPNPDDPTTEEPENPNTGDQTETPSGDTQNPTDETETDNNKQDQQDNDKTTTTNTTDKSENTDTATTVSNENKAPQTGDTTSLIYLATLAGSAVTGGTALGLRKKLKK